VAVWGAAAGGVGGDRPLAGETERSGRPGGRMGWRWRPDGASREARCGAAAGGESGALLLEVMVGHCGRRGRRAQ
jgi:hypothetical protein